MRIALFGNQNSGKTTLFNLLTGSNQKIANWPGVTIEKKSGIIKNTNHELIDLPGIYSLNTYSNEEYISRSFLLEEDIDLIINIVDVTSLERSLYLTTQLLEFGIRVIVALNMSDTLNKKGFTVDTRQLEKELGCDVVSISALKKTGIDELVSLIDKESKNYKVKVFPDFIEERISLISNEFNFIQKRFVSIKVLEEDQLFNYLINNDSNKYKEEIEKEFDLEIIELFASLRYDYLESIKKKVIIQIGNNSVTTDKIDKVLLNKYFGIPIFMVIMFLVYFLSVGIVGKLTVELIEEGFGVFNELIRNLLGKLGASTWAISLVVDGMLTGVGAVLAFVPQLIILFTLIALLETSGYMARITFLLDKLFKKLGLSGKSLIPFIVGSGCSVPGIMATRTIENDNERRMSILLTPFIPCSAKLPIIALFSGYFFNDYAGIASASLYFLSIIVIILSAILLKKFVYKGTQGSYIFELPEYKMPSVKYLGRDLFDKIVSFIKKAGTVILFSSIIVWFLSSFSIKFEYGVDIENSILAIIGRMFSWIFYPILGTNSWGATVSAFQGLVAKEQVVSSMRIIAGIADEGVSASIIFNKSGIFGFFNGVSAYAFMVFNLFSAPCLGSIGAMKKEYGKGRDVFKAVMFQTTLAWVLASLVYLIGSLL